MDKRLLILLIIIALGVWANFLATIGCQQSPFQPTPTFAYGDITDVNIKKVGGETLSYGGPILVEID